MPHEVGRPTSAWIAIAICTRRSKGRSISERRALVVAWSRYKALFAHRHVSWEPELSIRKLALKIRIPWIHRTITVAALATAALGCASSKIAAQPAPEGGTSRINTTVFDCSPIGAEAFEFTIRRGPGELALWLPLELNRPYLVLSQLPDAERDEYREGDVVVRLRAEGREADLTVGDTSFPGCRANAVRSPWEHAKLTGVDFRATGTNPDWSVEIRRGGQLVFRRESQTAPVSVATPEPETDDVRGYGIYRAATPDGDLTVTIGGGPCSAPDRADLTGSLVTVRVGAEIVSGCGRPLH